MSKPPVIVFDVNETLSDMSPVAERFTDLGVPGSMAALWFATLLRDGFALTAAGDQASFSRLAVECARDLFARHGGVDDVDGAAEHIVAGMRELRVHPDVADGVRALRAAGARLMTLSNGSTALADRLLTAAGIRGEFEALLSVEGVSPWKPARAAYERVAAASGVELGDAVLVAVHPWDIHGASRAGMRTAWLDRSGTAYPTYFDRPDHVIHSLTDLAGVLAPNPGNA